MKLTYVVTHHAHHIAENVYRLIYGHVVEEDDNTHIIPHDDIIWSVDDPRWKDKTPEQIAEEQKAIVKQMLEDREKESERTPPSVSHLGTAGQEL